MSRFDIVASFAAARWRAATLHGDRLRAYQERRAIAMVDMVRGRSPFYRALWNGQPSSAWRTYPTVTKQAMMDAFDRFTTTGTRLDTAMQAALEAERQRDFSTVVDGCTVGLSSGTSGHRGLFLVSPDEQTRWAGTVLSRAIPDLRPGHRVAFFLRANSRLYERTSSVVQFRFFDLMQPLDDVVSQLNAFGPRLIVGPPSLLGLLADAREQGALRSAPTRLIAVAEVMEPQDRARLERVFQAPVGEVYQCTEGLVAITCHRGALHVQEDVMVMQTEAISPSDASRVTPVLTDLWRRTQPIIRYRLGDVLRLDAAPCTCGSSWQRIAAIEGRQDDLCWFPTGEDTLRVIFPDAIRRMILLADERITEYHAVQPTAGELELHVAVRDSREFPVIATRLRDAVHAALGEYGCRAVSVTVHEGVPQSTPGTKRRRVVCMWRARAEVRTVLTA